MHLEPETARFNKSEQYLAACQDEAVRRHYKDMSSEDGRRHIYLCMIAHGYAFKESCGKEGGKARLLSFEV